MQKIVKSADLSKVKPAVFERIYNKMVKQVLIPHKKTKKDGLNDMIRKAFDIRNSADVKMINLYGDSHRTLRQKYSTPFTKVKPMKLDT